MEHPGPSLDPLGAARTLILLPLYSAFLTISVLINWAGWEPCGILPLLLILAHGILIGVLCGLAFIAAIRLRG